MDTRFKKGDRVFEAEGSPRNVATVIGLVHRNDGTFANLRFENGWKAFLIPVESLAAAEVEAPSGENEIDVLRAALRGERRVGANFKFNGKMVRRT